MAAAHGRGRHVGLRLGLCVDGLRGRRSRDANVATRARRASDKGGATLTFTVRVPPRSAVVCVLRADGTRHADGARVCVCATRTRDANVARVRDARATMCAVCVTRLTWGRCRVRGHCGGYLACTRDTDFDVFCLAWAETTACRCSGCYLPTRTRHMNKHGTRGTRLTNLGAVPTSAGIVVAVLCVGAGSRKERQPGLATG
eukprot:7119538-Prymnesium_polylepis.1